MSEVPWILSASDDQTVRLWDLERRTCVHVFTGHNHHVTCAAFHPTENLIVSASLDKTVRVWDTSRLVAFHKRGDYASGWARRNNVLVKYVLEGHERGVNWASFHPTLQILVSGSEDRRIKFWQLTETKAWEIFSLDRHIHSVTSCIFRDFPSHQDEVEHLDQLEVVSCSEDGRVCVFKVAPQKWHDGVWLDGAFRQRDEGRFWALAAHPTKNLVAAGHDSGFILFQVRTMYIVGSSK
jgi:coatomer protein complex subunit alpha (xenin)